MENIVLNKVTVIKKSFVSVVDVYHSMIFYIGLSGNKLSTQV